MCIAITCCIGSAICCAGSMCCSCLCWPCRKCGVNTKNFSRIGYIFFTGFMLLAAMFFMWLASLIFTASDWTGILECPNSTGGNTKACLGADSIVRMSFVLAVFYLIMVCAILPRGDGSAQFHDGCWTFKALFVIVCWFGTMFIPTVPFITGYMQFARAVSLLFLMY